MAGSLLLDLLRADWPSAHPGSLGQQKWFLNFYWLRLAFLILLILHFLGGAGERGAADEPRVAMADTSFSLFLRSGTCLEYERRESLGMGALGTETLVLCRESLGMGTRVFLGTETLELSLESLRGTVFGDSMRQDGGGAGSWTQFR